MAQNTTIFVRTSTRDQLARYKYAKRLRTMNEAIEDLLKQQEEKESQ